MVRDLGRQEIRSLSVGDNESISHEMSSFLEILHKDRKQSLGKYSKFTTNDANIWHCIVSVLLKKNACNFNFKKIT